MRIIRFIDDQGKTRLGLESADGVAQVLEGTWPGKVAATGAVAKVARLLAPVDPVNVFCIGLNYRQHAAESGSPLPEQPVVFMKPTTAVTAPGSPIVVPACCDHGPEVDYEVELAVVIGATARNVPESEALRHVLGYTIANDVSARRWQRHNGGQWVRGKSFDTFCPLGPVLVTPDELPDPQALRVRTVLNGQVVQDHNTSDMIFTVAQIIHFLSMDTTLLPGTVILTGTPQGVGFARKPPVWLMPGDTVSVEIDGIGALRNPVASAT